MLECHFNQFIVKNPQKLGQENNKDYMDFMEAINDIKLLAEMFEQNDTVREIRDDTCIISVTKPLVEPEEVVEIAGKFDAIIGTFYY